MQDPYSKLLAMITSLESRIQLLESERKKHQRSAVQLSDVEQKLDEHFASLEGRMTSSEIAAHIGADRSHVSLIAIGKALDRRKIPRVRNARGRMFEFKKRSAEPIRIPKAGPKFED